MNTMKSHTVIRNEQLFCFNCGVSHPLQLPMPLTEVTKLSKAFDLLHRDCPQTWSPPVPSATQKTEAENVMWWLKNGEQGISSKTILKYLHDRTLQLNSEHHPSDPDDFRRCHLLLEAVPQFRTRLGEMRRVSPVWGRLVGNWDKLTELLTEQMKTRKPNGMFELMKSLGC